MKLSLQDQEHNSYTLKSAPAPPCPSQTCLHFLEISVHLLSLTKSVHPYMLGFLLAPFLVLLYFCNKRALQVGTHLMASLTSHTVLMTEQSISGLILFPELQLLICT